MKYRLTEKIGSGGMAEVFRAIGEGPQGFERPFVIKRIHPGLSEAPEFVRMFVDEAKISSRLIHPNIVQVFEFAYQDGAYYIVMEPVEGMDMGWLLRRRRERRQELLSPAFVAEVGRQVCRGLDFAHSLTTPDGQALGIVHRDVTPPNIMVDWNGVVKILDFGIARAAQAIRTNLTEAGMVKGKMSYVAPELLEGQTADARSDLFSLGVVLHELLSGQQLFAGENDLDTLRLVKELVIPKPSTRNPGVKAGLDSVIMRALERDPSKRYQSAGEMGDDLETLVLRKAYSTRALARKARDLFQQEKERQAAAAAPAGAAPARAKRSTGPTKPLGEAAAPTAAVNGVSDGASHAGIGVAPPAPPAGVAEPPVAIGEEDSSLVVDESRQSPRTPVVAPRARPSGARPVVWLAAGVPCLLAAGMFGAILARSRPAVSDSARPVVEAAPVPAATTARIALDSIPQGATVTSSPLAGAEPIGQTPLLLDLPRGPSPVEVGLNKPGFAPVVYRIIPHQDKDVVVRLEPMVEAPARANVRRSGAGARRLTAHAAPANRPLQPTVQPTTARPHTVSVPVQNRLPAPITPITPPHRR